MINEKTLATLEEIRQADARHLTGKQIKTAKLFTKELFDPLLPYKASNGVYFGNRDRSSMTTNYGLIFGDNSFGDEDDYGLILKHCERAGDGSIGYDTSVRIDKVDHAALEKLALALEEKMVKRAKKTIAEFTKPDCSSCEFFMDKGSAFLCLFGDTREFMWIPEHIFKSTCCEYKKRRRMKDD